jgi:hypothetical protein
VSELSPELQEVLEWVKADVGRRWGWTTTYDVAGIPRMPLVSMSLEDRRHFQAVARRLRELEELHYLETDEREPGWWCLL